MAEKLAGGNTVVITTSMQRLLRTIHLGVIPLLRIFHEDTALFSR